MQLSLFNRYKASMLASHICCLLAATLFEKTEKKIFRRYILNSEQDGFCRFAVVDTAASGCSLLVLLRSSTNIKGNKNLVPAKGYRLQRDTMMSSLEGSKLNVLSFLLRKET